MRIESEKRRLEGATIDGIAVVDRLAYWRAGCGTKSA